MKTIPKIKIEGAVPLSPMEMNKIHFESGQHSEASPEKKSVILS